MGGSAFPSVYTPRMPEVVYQSVLEHVESRYKKHFRHVEQALEAPGKSSHGDIDVFVAEPINPPHIVDSNPNASIGNAIGARQCSRAPGGSTTSVVIDWPEEFASDIPPPSKESTTDSGGNNNKSAGIQVDVHICSTAEEMNWMLFLYAHGDLWSMLGVIIRRFGLINTPKGFVAYIEQTEKYSKEQSRVRMTKEPSQVLQFLGLDIERYWNPFNTLDEMMSYAATCRFHDPGRWAEKERTALRAKDRQRANKRPAFAYWTDNYIPAHQNDAAGRDARLSRDDILQQAKQFFGDEFASRFEQRKAEVLQHFGVSSMWAAIKKSIPATGVELSYVMKGLKAAMVPDDSESLADGETESQQGLYKVRIALVEGRFDEVQQWSMTNWKTIGLRQRRLEQAKRQLQKNGKPEYIQGCGTGAEEPGMAMALGRVTFTINDNANINNI